MCTSLGYFNGLGVFSQIILGGLQILGYIQDQKCLTLHVGLECVMNLKAQ